jgi:putrescine transport system substrate-binding protein
MSQRYSRVGLKMTECSCMQTQYNVVTKCLTLVCGYDMKRIGIFLYGCLLLFATAWAEEAVVNIYNWHSVIPEDIIAEFEQETGITVHYDTFDSNEVLELKLLTGNSGYDVVGPSAFPFLARQLQAKLYQPLNPTLIPNLAGLNPLIMKQLAKADPGNRHAVPLNWALIGFAYNADKIRERLPEAPVNSWAMFYNPETVRHFANCKTSMVEEGLEIIMPLFIYRHMNPLTDKKEDLQQAVKWLKEIRPFIARFDILRSIEDLFSGQVCLAMHWAGTLEHQKMQQPPGPARDNIKIVVPDEGTILFIDTLAIPAAAPHPKNAHAFINFMLRPEIAARITNHTYLANGVTASREFIHPEIYNNPHIYPPETEFHKYYMAEIIASDYHRRVNRIMLRLRTNRWN